MRALWTAALLAFVVGVFTDSYIVGWIAGTLLFFALTWSIVRVMMWAHRRRSSPAFQILKMKRRGNARRWMEE
jgi:hypothetical protein